MKVSYADQQIMPASMGDKLLLLQGEIDAYEEDQQKQQEKKMRGMKK